MNSNLEKIGTRVFNLMRSNSFIKKTRDIFPKYNLELNESEDIQEYGKYNLFQLIVLTRIERLCDLDLIDIEEKKFLLNIYRQYLEIYEELGKDIESEMLHNIKYDRFQHTILLGKFNAISEKLNKYGLLEEFDYKEAFINEIDSKLIQKIKK